MELQKQVVSLKLAKQMKALGFEQESLFWWVSVSIDNFRWQLVYGANVVVKTNVPRVSAHTVAELGEMLQSPILGYLKTTPLIDGFACGYKTAVKEHRTESNTEANVRAKMLIYLKENNLLEEPNTN